ncbi:DUF4865 family protein [Erwinia phyllosphaerae]|uniref:DUF4865 family protein n=1 Tax=Erwinia phyllosphaerae TaxID=2853256 RepID=UPI001FEE97C3|nr:DUF4865 family protein [Erwinia phyllosphaerae]MBV4365846.1 DUF4865 family protein [Erwinia phyllosphaerae]
MLAMQYKFTLPADYDMAIIKKRIELGGAKMDNFPGLLFKAYLYSSKKEGFTENSYAPFYLWRDPTSMQHFLQSPGFTTLTHDFGWPKIDCWPVLHSPELKEIEQAMYVSINVNNIAPYSDLTSMGTENMLCAWDVTRWQLLKTNFTKNLPTLHGSERNIYRIGYLAKGAV